MIRLKMMMESVRQTREGTTLGQRLWWLILGRVAVALFLLLLSGALWSREGFSIGQLGAMPVFIAVISLSLIYAVALRLSDRLRFQTACQLLIDVLLATWLVWLTGDVRSPYAALYILIISVASIFLGPRGALVTSVGCVVAFTGIALSTTFRALPHYASVGAEIAADKAIQIIGLNDVAFFFVGLLAAQLAVRQTRSDVQ